MEKPKPPASSQIRRPSTRPYARRKRETQGSDAAASSTELAAQLGAEVGETITAEATKAETARARSAARPDGKARPRGRAKPASPLAAVAAAADALDLAVVDAAVAAAIFDEPALTASAGPGIDSAAPVAIAEQATVPLTRPITASLSNAFAATALASVEAAIAAAIEDGADLAIPSPVTSLSQLPAREISEASASSLAVLSAALQLTELPSPRQLPTGAPTDAAPPPGLVPRGDSRSLRRGELFALVYRVHSFVITRHGKVGQLGHWSAIEYPTPSAASHAYARGCSHWVSEGFSDYRGQER